jgi:ribose transport system permease protein
MSVDEVRDEEVPSVAGLAPSGVVTPTSHSAYGGLRQKLGTTLERFALLICWLAVIGLFGALRPDQFLTLSNFGSMFGSQAVLVVLAIGLLPVLKAGDYDLSVAGVLTLSGMMVAVLNAKYGVPIIPTVLAALAMGVLVGAVNGFFAVKLGVDSFIVTLGVGTVLQGIVIDISGSQTLNGVSDHLVDNVIVRTFLGIPLAFYYGLAATVVMWYVFQHTVVGRRLLIVGRGRNVARLSGMGVSRIRFTSFVVAGLFSAIAGVLYAGTTGGADPTSGLSFLLPAYAAAFLGATSIVPGDFNAWGAFIAVYFLVAGITGLVILGAETYVQNIFYGGALVVAITLSRVSRRRARVAA